ncbi:MAG: type II toxin-antitoxin system YafQ family toxin [Bacteroidetes bacterium]|nr:type II toxin-antitoxin system YafQ family toxin [Bacteroidota bacterium]MBU1677817.1 type II toxin-antitoxin system YafQ family toxin [Bacteroidota bacterium]
MKLSVVFTKRFKKDFKKVEKHEKKMLQLKEVIMNIADGKLLNKRLLDHQLKGDYKDCRECHLASDFLLIYKIEDETLILVRCGSHAELFE